MSSGQVLLAAAFLSLLFRIYGISERPLHTDEAVNSIKLKYLIEDGVYKYDPVEYHGPTLYYFSLIISTISGVEKFEEINEIILRAVPVLISLILFWVLYLVKDSLEKSTIYISTVLIMVSPYFNFYSRYYIHEMPFAVIAFLLIGSLFNQFRSAKISWSVSTGVFAGLLFATKETSLIVFFALFVAIVSLRFHKAINLKLLLVSLTSFFVTAVVFFSSFFSNLQGALHSIIALENYFFKSAMNTEHIQPFYYYTKLLSYNYFKGLIISEVFVLIFAVIGIILVFRKAERSPNILLIKFISIFTIVYWIILSAIPYKTPWNILIGWIGLLIISAHGITYTYNFIRSRNLRIVFTVIVITNIFYFGFQTYLTSYKYSSESDNPYTYSQPTTEIYELTGEIDNILRYDNMLRIAVIAEDNQYWPLPFYLRKAENVAWNSSPNSELFKFDLILAEPKYIEEITNILYNLPQPGKIDLYVPFTEHEISIRPGLKMTSYIKHDVLVKFKNSSNYIYND
ncbi:MAG: TIGR03663 family protein [Melioribacteraceae bacterium]|nr:TIGR03663 family protein [Melioribacteraceae bacterium]MCF8266041.1 TIGR03663 family protein [Melioribacteraceae bacterium]MCF8413970.1 TIGR03663 family protein [Melioribacteraceae bacterium]